MAINTVTISGRLTKDPELRTSASGASILEMGIAVNEGRKNPQTGQWEERANFFDAVLFGNRAEKLCPMLDKGSKVVIHGRLRYESWKAKDGTNRSKVTIVANEIEFLSRREAPAPQDAGQDPAQGGYAPELASYGYADEDIEF